MSSITKVLVTKNNLDSLADSISTKSGVSTPMTLSQMKTAIDNIEIIEVEFDSTDKILDIY